MNLNHRIKKIHWNTLHDCNLSCDFCYLWREKDAKPLSTHIAKQLISQCAENKAEWFVFGGGDPLMRIDLPVLLAHSKKAGLKNDLQTNAQLLSDQLFDSIYKNVDRIGLSIDGEDEAVHDSVRKSTGHLNCVLKALERCEQAKLPVVIRTTVLKSNIGKLVGIGKILSTYSCISKWSIREFVPLGRGLISKSKFFISREEFLDEARNIMQHNARSTKFPILTVTADDMNSCYCLVTTDGHFYTHPQYAYYSSSGKFPLETVSEILFKLNYNVALRDHRDYREELALSTIHE